MAKEKEKSKLAPRFPGCEGAPVTKIRMKEKE